MAQPTPDPNVVAVEMVTFMSAMVTATLPIAEACQGYRERLKREGWSDTAAEKMAVDFHAALIRKVLP